MKLKRHTRSMRHALFVSLFLVLNVGLGIEAAEVGLGDFVLRESVHELQCAEDNLVKISGGWTMVFPIAGARGVPGSLEASPSGHMHACGLGLLQPLLHSELEGLLAEVTPINAGTLSPPVKEGDYRGNESTSKDGRPSGDYCNALYVFLFLWGHEWWVLVIWWGLMAFPIVVLADFIYGVIHEFRIFKTNVRSAPTGATEWWLK
jgi:hypothetical protein